MALIQGKDFCFDVPDEVLVRMAAQELKESGEQVTVQSVAAFAGISEDAVRVVAAQMKAKQGEK